MLLLHFTKDSSYLVHKVDGPYKGWSLNEVHKVDGPYKGWLLDEVHKMDGPYKGKLLDKSTKWTDQVHENGRTQLG